MSVVVMFVRNDMTLDSRVIREASSLAAIGHSVTVMAIPRNPTSPSVSVQRQNGFRVVHVPPPLGWRGLWWVFLGRPRKLIGHFRYALVRNLLAGPRRWPAAALALGALLAVLPWAIVLLAYERLPDRGGAERDHLPELSWLARWRFEILGWAARAASEAPLASVYHAHDLTALPAAVAARARAGSGELVYDCHEIFLESGENPKLPRWSRWLLRRWERRWSSGAAALVTVNEPLAQVLAEDLRPPRVVVVHNCPPRWDPPDEPLDLLRPAAGLPPDTPLVLYHGRLTTQRGLPELAEAILEPGLEGVHAVYLGYGPYRQWLEELAAQARVGGRLHVLDAVPPEQLVDWIASADVNVVALQRSTRNHYLATPNKLFESLGAGVPVVVSDFPAMRQVILDDPEGPLGAVCDPSDPTSIAAAILSILTLAPTERAALRARCLRAAHERWNWETESARLLALYGDLAPISGQR